MAGTPPATWAMPPASRPLADHRRIGLERLMRREHVVIGGDDAEVRHTVAGKRVLLGGGTDREAVGEVAAAEHRAGHALGRRAHALEIGSRSVSSVRRCGR
jgi:hypothetical protein